MIRYFGAILALCFGMSYGHAAELPPIEHFLAPAEYYTPKLTPDGKFYGIVGARLNSEALLMVELATGKSTAIVKFGNSRIINFWWKGSNLVLLLFEDRLGFREFRSYELRPDGAKETVLPSLLRESKAPGYQYVIMLINPLQGDPDNVLVATTDAMSMDLWRLNVRSGSKELVKGADGAIKQWLTDAQGQPRAGLGLFHEDSYLTFPTQPGQPWRQVKLGDKNLPDFLPLAVATDQQRIIGVDFATADTARMVAWNPAGDSQEGLWQSPEVDVQSFQTWGDDPTRVRSISYETDRRRLHFLTSEDRELGRLIDTALAQTTNYVVSTSHDESRMIIAARSETVPEDYYLFDQKTRKLAKLGSAYPAIKPATLTPGRYFAFPARDGLTLHGRIYLPPGATGASPAVLWIENLTDRVTAGYNADFQLLLSRGFAVVGIDHRGVGGYGRKFEEAGSLQLGGAMTDDLVDGLDWLAKEGLIDLQRIALAGKEQGGILAMQTLARHPGRFRVWINYSTTMEIGDWDLDRIIYGRLSKDERKQRAGGSGAGRDYLRSIDPMAAVTMIKVPSFHFYSRYEYDQRANLYDKRSFRADRLEKYLKQTSEPHVFLIGKELSRIRDYEDRSEQIRLDERKRIWSELLKFLDQYLAKTR